LAIALPDKEQTMDNFQTAILMMALNDTDWGPRDAHGWRRQLTAEELDALADFGWHVPDMRGFVTACGNAVRECWRWATRKRIGSAKLTTVESG
jgi:hypothetical protein